MGTLIFLILLISGIMLMLLWAFTIRDRKKRYNFLWGTHVVTIVPGSVGLSNKIFPPNDILNILLALVTTLGMVTIIWFGVAKLYSLKKRMNNKAQV